MCDQDHFDEDLKKYSRRDLGLIMSGIGLTMLLPRSANAAEVSEKEVEIKTGSGICDAYFVTPKSGAHAAVLVWPDIFWVATGNATNGQKIS